MTVVQDRPRMLSAADGAAVSGLVAGDPVLHCVLDTRLRIAPDLNPNRLGGFLWGVPSGPDGTGAHQLRAAAFHGGNLIPIVHRRTGRRGVDDVGGAGQAVGAGSGDPAEPAVAVHQPAGRR
jgi:hypothetical protein